MIYQDLLMYEHIMAPASTKVAVTKDRAVQLFHALSDQTRLRILERLQGGEQCVCELMDVFKTGQSRLSFHLRVLKDTGLVIDRREGRWMYYSLNHDALVELNDVASRFLDGLGEAVSTRQT